MKSYIITFLLATLAAANPLPESNAETGEVAVFRVTSGDVSSAQDCPGNWKCPDLLYPYLCCLHDPPICCPGAYSTCYVVGGIPVCNYQWGKYITQRPPY